MMTGLPTTQLKLALLTAGVVSLPCIAYWAFASRKSQQYERFLKIAANTKCRYRLDNETSAVLNLPGGRELGYAEYGAPKGKAIFYLHGLPGSRIEAAALHDPAVESNIRIIAVDRPGYGWSSPHLGRTIPDHVQDIQVLGRHLGLREYGVLVCSICRRPFAWITN